FSDPATAMAVSGTSVYVGGVFTQVSGQPANFLAKFDDSQVVYPTPYITPYATPYVTPVSGPVTPPPTGATFLTGSLVNDAGTGYLIQGSKKIAFTSFTAFNGLGYSLKNVVKGNLSNYTMASNYWID